MRKALVKENSKITFRDIVSVFWRWWFVCEMSNSYERMQAISYCYAMIPVLKKLYPDKEDFKEALQRHLIFFNTEGICGNVILGMTIALEEENAESGGKLGGESIVSLKTALMGPVAGIGDTITWGTIKQLIMALALSISVDGSIGGWFVIWLFVPITLAYGWLLMTLGYSVGRTAFTNLMESGWVDRIIYGCSVLGLFMIGGLAASYIDFQLTGTFMNAGVETTYQSVLDGIVPGMIPLAAIFAFRSYYIKNKGKGMLLGRLVLVVLVVCCLLSLIGLI